MGDQPSARRGPPAVRRDRPPAKPAKPSDPIFSAPYEPSGAQAAQPSAEAPQPQSKRRQPQIAALLKLKRA